MTCDGGEGEHGGGWHRLAAACTARAAAPAAQVHAGLHPTARRPPQAWVEMATVQGEDEGSELDEWGSESLTPTPTSPGGPQHGRVAAAAAGGGGRSGGQALPPVEEASREGRASTPSKGARGLATASEAASGSSGSSSSSSSSSGSETSSTGSEGSTSGLADEPSASFLAGGGNLAVAGANALLAAHGSGSDLQRRARPPSSQATAGFLSASWDSQNGSLSASQSGTLSESGGAGVGARRPHGGRAAHTPTGSSDFTFDRSRPAAPGSGWAGGSSATQPSRARRGHQVQQQTLYIQVGGRASGCVPGAMHAALHRPGEAGLHMLTSHAPSPPGTDGVLVRRGRAGSYGAARVWRALPSSAATAAALPLLGQPLGT